MQIVKQLADTLNHYAPALTLLVVIGGFVWTIATWNAEFGIVKSDLAELRDDLAEFGDDLDQLRDDLEEVREEVRSVREEVREEVRSVREEVRSVQEEVRSVQETLSHIVSCIIDLERSRIASALGGGDSSRGDAPVTLFDGTLPASCEQARSRTTPQAN